MNKKTYELKESRNGDIIPVIDGVHLHSIYDPQKEALNFVECNLAGIESNTNFIILGLGFGYHIQALINHLDSIKVKNYSIVVIEENTQLTQDFINSREFSSSKVSIYNPKTIDILFEDFNFISFLKTRPSILKHDLSFEINEDFYKMLLTYKAPTSFSKFQHLLSDEAQKMYFSSLEESLNERLNIIKTQTGATHREDFALLAIDSLR